MSWRQWNTYIYLYNDDKSISDIPTFLAMITNCNKIEAEEKAKKLALQRGLSGLIDIHSA